VAPASSRFAASSGIDLVVHINLTIFSNTIMPISHVREDGHLKKPVKSGSTSRNTYTFSDGADVQRHLQKQDNLTDGE
jgi:hypothetical protein